MRYKLIQAANVGVKNWIWFFYIKLYLMSIITVHNGILVQLMAKTINAVFIFDESFIDIY